MPRVAVPLLLLAALATLAACDGTPDADDTQLVPPVACTAASATATASVLLGAMQFLPFCTTVGVGVPLTFTNVDSVNHSVTADAGQPEPFESGLLLPGQSFAHTFAQPETVRVHDRLNPQMSGIVIVQ